MKRILAVILCLLLLIPTAALPTMVASADTEGRVIMNLDNMRANVSKKLSGNGYVCAPNAIFSAVDLSSYNFNDLAVEADFYLEGDATAFKNGLNAWLELTSSGTNDEQELNWNLSNIAWQSDKWFRTTLKLSAAGKAGTTAFDVTKANYLRMYFYAPGCNDQQITFKYCNVRIVDLSKGAVGTDPVGDGTFKVGDPDWELVDTTYDTTEALIAGYNLGDYLAPNTDTDATPAIQTLLDALFAAGGGTLFVPEGSYTLKGTLLLQEGVTLQGDWRAPTEQHPEAVGTILKIYAGKGNTNGTPFITMRPNTAVQGLTFWYPEQDAENVVEYPLTIQMFDNSSWGKDYTHVRNCTFVNSYRAVQQGPGGSGCANVYNVYGTPLFAGLKMDNIADIGRFDYVHFAPSYWETCGLPGAPTSTAAKTALEKHVRDNATGMIIGRVDWSYWAFNEVTGYKTGMYFKESDADPGAFSNGHVYGSTFTDCDTAILIDGISSAGELFANITIKNCTTGIETAYNTIQNDAGNLQMNFITIDAETAIRHAGTMRLFLNASTVERGSVVLSCGPCSISGTEFRTAAPHVTAARGASSVILQGNTVKDGEFTVSNVCMCPLQYSDTPVKMDEIDLMTGDQSVDDTVKAAREMLYVADFDKTGKTDITAKLQALLTKAGTEGGGYVFLPGGYYRLNGSVTVPAGVELVGAVNVGRNVFKTGTILEVYGTQTDATVILSENSGLRGIVFDYPTQSNTMEGLNTKFPYAVQGRGANVYLVNVTIRNGFDGVDLMTYRCDNHYVKYLAGYCFHSVIKVGGGSVGGKIINYQMNSSAWWNGDESKYGTWPNCPTKEEKAEGGGAQLLRDVYTQSNCVILTVGDVTDQVLYDNFSYLGAVGAYYVEENGKGANGWNVGNAYDYSSVGIQIDGIGDMDFINPQIVSYNHYNIDKTRHHIYLTDKCDDTVNVINLACWASPNTYLRADSGTLNVFCGDFTGSTESNCFATIGENAAIHLQNGTITNTNVASLTQGNANMQNLTVNGYINERSMNGENNAKWGTNMVRVARWDVPENATIDTTQKMVFTEAFTGYATETSNEIPNVLSKNGSFNVICAAKPGSNATLVNESGNDMLRLFHDNTVQSVFARNSSAAFASGKANSLYQLETRLNIKSLRDHADANLLLMIYTMKGSSGSGQMKLVSFQPDGVYVNDEKLTAYSENTWYRLQVTFDLRDVANKTYKVTLLDDNYKVVATGDTTALPAAYQNNTDGVGAMNFTATAPSDAAGTKVTEALVDYLFVTQDPTVVPDVMLGDVDGDEKITTTDARLTLQFTADKITADKLDLAAADVDKDTKVSTTDARMILQYAAQKITSFD